MSAPAMENDFLSKLKKVIEENIADEMFGVSELAGDVGMSRSNLLRKVKKLANVSASQFIRQVRLQKATEMLKQTSLTVSEVSYKVGFGSTSYFIKCFREEYGYPPGEVGKKSDRNSGPSGDRIQKHQLAAIMFTDIEGYTALMQQNEEKAIAFRNRHREVFNSVTEKYKGNILQYYGDGTLSTFSSAIDAVRCGIELQLAFREEPRIPVRIGIHSGDILFSEDGIIGDGVNVASRIESLAVPQSVLISEKIYDEVKNQPEIQTISMGIFELKNVEKPIEVFAIKNPGLIVPDKDHLSGKLKTEPKSLQKEPDVKSRRVAINWILLPIIAILFGYFLYTSDIFRKTSKSNNGHITTKKSIAVLPFINDSNDSSNVYIINGLMESTLNNLQKIKDLRVISRTSVEKYRNSTKTSPEIGKELNAQYLIEGSGQKIGDQIMLHIQLIDATHDQHLWSEQYNREVKDIFVLQREIAKKIAGEIEIFISPEVEERINKVPTSDLVAYDYFLKGLDLLNNPTRENLENAIMHFKQAIEHDDNFARAYADIAIAYYFLDVFQVEKRYTEQIGFYADKAILIDAQLPQSLIAKAVFYMNNKAYDQALPYLEKALEYNPNSDLVIRFLADFYANHSPDTEKYLEYSLKGIQLDIASYDSSTVSVIYLHISNALIQSGFVDEAEKYIYKSLDYDPQNLYSEYLKAYILFAKDRDLQQMKENLLATLQRDSTRIDIIQETGKVYYYLRDYINAYRYYKKLIDMREAQNLDIFNYENDKIGVVLEKVGMVDESEKYLREYLEATEISSSIEKHYNLAMLYSYNGETAKAMEQMRLFSQEDNYTYWTFVFAKLDPLFDNIKSQPEFESILSELEIKFWKKHENIKASLKKEGLL